MNHQTCVSAPELGPGAKGAHAGAPLRTKTTMKPTATPGGHRNTAPAIDYSLGAAAFFLVFRALFRISLLNCQAMSFCPQKTI